jgi:hypothetical protein
MLMRHAPWPRALTLAFVAWTPSCNDAETQAACPACTPMSAGACALDGGAAQDAGTTGGSCLAVLGAYDGVDALGMPTQDLAISVKWSPVDELALTGSEGHLRLLRVDPASGALTRLAEDDTPRDRIFVAWSPDGRFAMSGSLDVRLIAVTTSPPGLTELATYSGHRGSVYAVSFSPDGNYALTAGQDATVRLLRVDGDAGTVTELAVYRGHSSKVYEAAWSPDGRSAWTASQDGTARVLDVDVGAPALRERSVVRRDVAVTTIAPSPVEHRHDGPTRARGARRSSERAPRPRMARGRRALAHRRSRRHGRALPRPPR